MFKGNYILLFLKTNKERIENMKKGFSLLMILCVAWIVASCNNDMQSYVEMLEAEQDAMERFMKENNFEVLEDYPADGIFQENQFYKLSNDVYLNVIDSGNGVHASEGERVFCRFRVQFFKSDTVTIDGFSNDYWYGPAIFQYTDLTQPYAYVSIASGSDATDFISNGLASGLMYVGDSSYVKLIVPFKESSQTFKSMGEPLYFSRVRYIFDR